VAQKPNVIFILADQLRAASLPLYGERQLQTPNIDRLARSGVVLDQAISTCPVCTPYRSMLLTGRHPQTTGHIINFVRTRHDELGIGDAFARAGCRTGWIGKWHLHTGSFPEINGKDYVPQGRDRLGFQHWRGYNFHMQYFDGHVNLDDWRVERWKGYETDALARYAFEFLDGPRDRPFCLFLSPHQPHFAPGPLAPEAYYARLPAKLELPANVSPAWRARAADMYRHYLAMTLAVDDMLGALLDYLDRTGLADNTLVVFTSDHGTQGGAHDLHPWAKKEPYEESLRVPWIMRWPGVLEGGARRDPLVAPVDIFPTLCGLCGIEPPRALAGHDLSAALRGLPGAFEQEAVLTMNFTAAHDYLVDGAEWRGVRTKRHAYARRLSGKVELFDLENDPLEMTNLAERPEAQAVRARLEETMVGLMAPLGDRLGPCHAYAEWFDAQRRVIRNARGPLGNPEAPPDWSRFSELNC